MYYNIVYLLASSLQQVPGIPQATKDKVTEGQNIAFIVTMILSSLNLLQVFGKSKQFGNATEATLIMIHWAICYSAWYGVSDRFAKNRRRKSYFGILNLQN